MKWLTLLLILIGSATEAEEAAWPTGEHVSPSGQLIVLQEILFEEHPYSGEQQVVVRLLAPMIAGEGFEASELSTDMEWACETWGLAAGGILSMPPDWIIVEMMEAPLERGQTTPEIRQYFETYRPEGPLCIWELF